MNPLFAPKSGTHLGFVTQITSITNSAVFYFKKFYLKKLAKKRNELEIAPKT